MLSGAPNVTAEAREKVMEAARRLAYEGNNLAQGLRSGRTDMLGLVVPDIANPYWAEVARGAQDCAAQNGASLLVFSSDWNIEREAEHLVALRRARVEGVLINPISDNVDEMRRSGLPVVLIGSIADRFPEMAAVTSDIAQGVHLGLDHLISKGHSRPAFIVGTRYRLARVRFMRAVHDHFVARDMDPGDVEIAEGAFTFETGYQAMQQLLEKRRGHLSVFAANDLMALGALMAVGEAGLRCPEEVSILGFDGIPAGAFAFPGLTSVSKTGRAVGIASIRVLISEIADRSGAREVLPCELVERRSIADHSQPQKLLRVARG